MAVAGILAIQAGDNPRIVAKKLASFVDPAVLRAASAPATEGTQATAPTATANAAEPA